MQMQLHPLFGRCILLDIFRHHRHRFRGQDIGFGVFVVFVCTGNQHTGAVPEFLHRRMLVLIARTGFVGPQNDRNRIGAVGDVEGVAEAGALTEILYFVAKDGFKENHLLAI